MQDDEARQQIALLQADVKEMKANRRAQRVATFVAVSVLALGLSAVTGYRFGRHEARLDHMANVLVELEARMDDAELCEDDLAYRIGKNWAEMTNLREAAVDAGCIEPEPVAR